MRVFYPTCPTCTGPVTVTQPHWLDGRKLRLSCGECGRNVPRRAWRRWVT